MECRKEIIGEPSWFSEDTLRGKALNCNYQPICIPSYEAYYVLTQLKENV